MCLCEIICESPASSESLLWSGHPWPRRSPQSFLAEMCWTSAHMWMAYPSCWRQPRLASSHPVWAALQHQPGHCPMPSACKDSFDGFLLLLVSFIDIYFSLLWKLSLPSAYGEGWLLFCLQVTPRAEDSQVSSTRSVCGALDIASSKLTNKLILDFAVCNAYLFFSNRF